MLSDDLQAGGKPNGKGAVGFLSGERGDWPGGMGLPCGDSASRIRASLEAPREAPRMADACICSLRESYGSRRSLICLMAQKLS